MNEPLVRGADLLEALGVMLRSMATHRLDIGDLERFDIKFDVEPQ